MLLLQFINEDVMTSAICGFSLVAFGYESNRRRNEEDGEATGEEMKEDGATTVPSNEATSNW